jgi:DNA-directed RNA polymerase subunit RPC12/RpoP
MQYYVACQCGEELKIRPGQAGSSLECPACKHELLVPSVSQLKRGTGDDRPYLDAIQRLSTALAERSEPFTGECPFCNGGLAQVSRTVTYQSLTERWVSDREGLQPTGLGMAMVIGEAREQWKVLHFPLMFCDDCHSKFVKDWRSSTLKQTGKVLASMVIYVPVVLFAMVLAIFLPFLSVALVVLVVAMIVRYRTRKKVDPFIRATFSRLPIVKDVLAGEDEYRIEVSPANAIKSTVRGRPE